MLHENRLRFHMQPVPSTPALASLTMRREARNGGVLLRGQAGVSQALDDFLGFVEKLIPHDKFKVFKSLFRFPVKTNEITAVCFDKLSRIFDGRDPVYNYQFATAEERDDWEWYRHEVIGEPDVWQTDGWEHFQTDINCVMVVDMPAEQDASDPYPRPYFYFLNIADVITFKAERKSSVMRYIIFRQDDDKIAVIDDERYRVFRKDGSDNIGELLVDNPHDLGYCPARFLWDEPMSLQEPDIKRSPVTKQLDNLDWFLFYAISKRYLDMYGSYPIYSGYEQNCDYHNDETGDYCDGGFLKDRKGHWIYDNNVLCACPKCGDKRIVGAGSFIEVPIPIEGQPDLRNPVQMLTVDRQSLDYNVEEEDRLRTNIITGIVGTNEEITTRDALNEQQIKANFESQANVLGRVKKGFEAAQTWVDETICRLRYGSLFISANINYGTEFYLFTTDELRERYKVAKEAGSSESELDALHEKIIASEYRNDPQMLQRMVILTELEPYIHMTRDEVQQMYDKGLITREELMLKMNFSDYVRRFERENINVLEFGANTDFERKIETIRDQLLAYAGEQVGNVEPNKPNSNEQTIAADAARVPAQLNTEPDE